MRDLGSVQVRPSQPSERVVENMFPGQQPLYSDLGLFSDGATETWAQNPLDMEWLNAMPFEMEF